MAALTAVPFALPAASVGQDGAAGSNSGGGVTYETAPATSEPIALSVRRGAWLGRSVRIRGTAEGLAGETVAVERRRGGRWEVLRTVVVGEDGRFATRWKPRRAGRHRLRALAMGASAADGPRARSASSVRRLTVYRRVVATWYGPGFYGNRTACGQRLTTRTQGVAHKTLPCGTRVAIRYGRRSVVVPVIDRGPYAHGASYDLTGATARALGVTHTSRIGAAVVTRKR